MGFARQRAVAYFFGTGPYADVFFFALRAPNLLQNLLGEGTLSASFIPIYSRMLEEGREEEAGRFAGAIFGLLLALAGALTLTGVFFAEPIVTLLAFGFRHSAASVVDRFPLAVTAVRITFPMTGFLVLSAWALGVLNSHRRFFLPYVAPAVWNASIVAALVAAGHLMIAGRLAPGAAGISSATLDRLLFAACLGALVGGLLQFGVQVPLVLRVLKGFRVSLSTRVTGVRSAIRRFFPVVAGRGVAQLGGYLDIVLASLLAEGALAAMGYALMLYLLPISLFAMSVAAAELPELSRSSGSAPARIDRSLRQVALLTVPTVVGYLVFGYVVAGAIFRTGSFGRASNLLVYVTLAGFTLGLPASAGSRLFQNVFFALGDTRTPAKIAAQRVTLAAVVSIPLMFWLDRFTVAAVWPGGPVPPEASSLHLGALGLALGSAVGAWWELVSLLRSARPRVDGIEIPWRALGRMAGLAVAAAVPGTLLWWLLPRLHPLPLAVLVLGAFTSLYLGGAALARFPEMDSWLGRLGRRFRRR
jgi:putative peptidoglycan lipid II flippase